MSTDEVINPNAAPHELKASDRLCPLLTIAGALHPASPIVGASPAPFSAVPCQGISCAFFLPMTDPEGKVVGGGCAVTALPTVLDSHAGVVGGVLKVLSNRAKIGLAPGIQV